MTKITKRLAVILSISSATILAGPLASAQDNSSSNGNSTSNSAQRVDYKSPPSPELLAQQNGTAPPVSTPSAAAASKSKSKKTKETKPKKREPRETPL